MLLAISSLTMNAQPMSYQAMRDNARFLTDRMAYTLGIAPSLLDDLYMINFDYIYGVNDYLDDIAIGYHYDDYMAICYARDAALRRLLSPYQWDRYIALDYFYRPISFTANRWRFAVYNYYPRTGHFYYRKPHHFASYHGGNFFAGMRPAGGRVGPGHIGGPAPHGAQPGGNHPHDNGITHPGNDHGNAGTHPGNNHNSNRGTFDSSRSSSRTSQGQRTMDNGQRTTVSNRQNTPATRSAGNGTTNANGVSRGAGRR